MVLGGEDTNDVDLPPEQQTQLVREEDGDGALI